VVLYEWLAGAMFTATAAHEWAESVTDPTFLGFREASTFDELADICETVAPSYPTTAAPL
jgi:hypothetical protein